MGKRRSVNLDVYTREDGTLFSDQDSFFAELEKNFKDGKDPGALEAVAWFLFSDRPVPDWAIVAFRHAYSRGSLGEIKSWDEVFGKPQTKPQNDKLIHHLKAQYEIWHMVAEAKQQGTPIDNALFDDIGSRVGCGRSTAWVLYEKARKYRGEP
jgi:hypothetical protein